MYLSDIYTNNAGNFCTHLKYLFLLLTESIYLLFLFIFVAMVPDSQVKMSEFLGLINLMFLHRYELLL